MCENKWSLSAHIWPCSIFCKKNRLVPEWWCRWELHAFIKVSFKVAAVVPVSHSHSFCPRPQSIFPSNYFPFCAAPCLTMMDHRLKTDVFSSDGVGLTQAHILFLPQTSGPWKDCVPLCFSHSTTIQFVFIFFCLGHFFVMYGCSTSQRQKCRLCQSHANPFMIEESVEVLVKCKKGARINGPRCRNVLKEQWNRQRNCCEISPF